MYILTEYLKAQLTIAKTLGGAFLLQGPASSGKTSWAYALAEATGAELFRYDCRGGSETQLFWEYDVDGLVKRKGAYTKGPLWNAYEASESGKVIVLLDEWDKTYPEFDAEGLRILDDDLRYGSQFMAPTGEVVKGNINNITYIITSNQRRPLRPELVSRMARINFEFPSQERMFEICHSKMETEVPKGLHNILYRVGAGLGQNLGAESRPGAREMVRTLKVLALLWAKGQTDRKIWEEVIAGNLAHSGQAESVTLGFDWAQACLTEAKKGWS